MADIPNSHLAYTLGMKDWGVYLLKTAQVVEDRPSVMCYRRSFVIDIDNDVQLVLVIVVEYLKCQKN